MSLTQVDIYNESLLRLGAKTITSITEDSLEVRCLNIIYDQVRRDLLSRYNWNFATTRAELSQLVETPAFEFNYYFALPSDVLRIVQFHDLGIEYKREITPTGVDAIATNSSILKLKYIADVSDTSKFSPIFGRALAMALAYAVGQRLDQSMTLLSMIDRDFEKILNKAKNIEYSQNSNTQLNIYGYDNLGGASYGNYSIDRNTYVYPND